MTRDNSRDDEDLSQVGSDPAAEAEVDAAAETRVVLDEEPSAESDGEDDRTQLVPRNSAETASDVGEAASPATAKDTQGLDPDAGAASARRVPDTRVLDEPDKTAPASGSSP